MDRVCDEVLQLIFFELDNPAPLTLTTRRFHAFAQDPYVRAHYFLARHGNVEALFFALGRGKLLTERVIDILLTSGANLSRYLVQVAIHHYFHTAAHFVKTPWVRNVRFPVFSHLLATAAQRFGEIPVGKGEDDGTLFATFLKESRFPRDMKNVKVEDIKVVLEKYKFIPFSMKDPLSTSFPLALAVEPQLLPLAIANGFRMDVKYRDCVFRKMFERPTVLSATADGRVDDIVRNVRELCHLDPAMFLSRTVAAEVCMEAKVNEHAYNALKKLDQAGDLLFELSILVADLIKLFLKARSITQLHIINCLQKLYGDFPSSDPSVRLVMITSVFLSDRSRDTSAAALEEKFESLGLAPLSRRDIVNVLVNPFIEKPPRILAYARDTLGITGPETRLLAEEVALKCLEVGCKGRMLLDLCDRFRYLHDTISSAVVPKYQLQVEDLPEPLDSQACATYQAKLARDYMMPRSMNGDEGDEGADGPEPSAVSEDEDSDHDSEAMEVLSASGSSEADQGTQELGHIGHDTLSNMIRQDEAAPLRARRRHLYYLTYHDLTAKYAYPSDAMQVGCWIKDQYGPRSHVTAIFMTHAVINENHEVLRRYMGHESRSGSVANHVPITLRHFRLLARLGKHPSDYIWHDIQMGAEFFETEDDYLSKDADVKPFARVNVKAETPPSPVEASPVASSSRIKPSSPARAKADASPRLRKRPRRSTAAAVKSYVDPDSDDDAIAEDANSLRQIREQTRKRKVESNLQRWIKHLAVLLKEEQRKYKEKKKRIEQNSPPDVKLRVSKSDFLKSLASHLRELRKHDQEKRAELYGAEALQDDYSDGDDDEYKHVRPTKRRKTTIASTT
ncbi:hypothetical protein PLICRDRAFT_55897 [Plicaturopsis crispa FD-325 SS-3]|nr:hypothetical protein PLICRDRAFT_55897 [Plicaturopsis crispa FD-325 SS-3]